MLQQVTLGFWKKLDDHAVDPKLAQSDTESGSSQRHFSWFFGRCGLSWSGSLGVGETYRDLTFHESMEEDK